MWVLNNLDFSWQSSFRTRSKSKPKIMWSNIVIFHTLEILIFESHQICWICDIINESNTKPLTWMKASTPNSSRGRWIGKSENANLSDESGRANIRLPSRSLVGSSSTSIFARPEMYNVCMTSNIIESSMFHGSSIFLIWVMQFSKKSVYYTWCWNRQI